MNTYFQNINSQQQKQSIYSFHEPALRVLDELYERNKRNLRSKGYDENNSAITHKEFSLVIAHRFRISVFLAQQIVNSLVRAEMVEAFCGYVKPKVVQS